MAEATLAISIVRPDEHWRTVQSDTRDGTDTGRVALVSTGAPLEGVSVRIGNDSRSNGCGPIEVRSPGLLERYIGADLELTEDGYFITGDIGMIDDGEVVVVGRRDDVLVVAGQNYYPSDIESEAAHEGVRPGCVAAVAASDGGVALVAEPRFARASTDDLKALAGALRAQVARSIGVAPRTVAWVARGTLPKTPSGKLRRPLIAASLRDSDDFLVMVDFA
jgi:acyl-CoA synthetase (AMP-forming)/AMP-acid ligase II